MRGVGKHIFLSNTTRIEYGKIGVDKWVIISNIINVYLK